MAQKTPTFLKASSILAAAILAVYIAYIFGDFIFFIIKIHPDSNALRLQLATNYAWKFIHLLALGSITLMCYFAGQLSSLKAEIKNLKEER